ncbi:hypothetical protein LIER_00465 [Lithospermum erythrorhizon]|uniref:Reverse transcriptase n=1 Tax=Lithospermum erythrorhizon TaxID=34254 RepID=A0AAV3NL43_LITER
MDYVTSISYSDLINGSQSGFFRPGRGLRQGSTLSSYLFIILNLRGEKYKFVPALWMKWVVPKARWRSRASCLTHDGDYRGLNTMLHQGVVPKTRWKVIVGSTGWYRSQGTMESRCIF